MQGFMITLLTCSVTMSALALLYMAFVPALSKRYSTKWLYYAWLAIVIGLIIPFRPQLGGSAIVKVDIPSGMAIPIAQLGNDQPPSIFPVETPIDGATPSFAPTAFPWWQIAAAVWLAGVAAFLANSFIKHCSFLKIARRWSEDSMDEKTLALLNTLKADMGIAKPIGIRLSSSVGSPTLASFANPLIFLPTKELTQDELRFIIRHELVHFKRKDLLYRYSVLAATALHWFNPVVHLMARAINALCEMSCDGEVVQNADMDTRLSYSEAIIGVVGHKSRMTTALSTNFYGGKKGMRIRLSSVMDDRNKKAGIIINCLVLALVLGTGLVFSASPAQPTDSFALTQQNEDSASEDTYDGSYSSTDDGTDDGADDGAYDDAYYDAYDGATDVVADYVQHGPRHFTGAGSMEKALEADGMVGVVGVNLNTGWAYARELDLFWDTQVSDPEQALAYMQKRSDYAIEQGNVRYVDVYGFDGETVIDTFKVEETGEVLHGNPLIESKRPQSSGTGIGCGYDPKTGEGIVFGPGYDNTLFSGVVSEEELREIAQHIHETTDKYIPPDIEALMSKNLSSEQQKRLPSFELGDDGLYRIDAVSADGSRGWSIYDPAAGTISHFDENGAGRGSRKVSSQEDVEAFAAAVRKNWLDWN